jgi:hypothetical protein
MSDPVRLVLPFGEGQAAFDALPTDVRLQVASASERLLPNNCVLEVIDEDGQVLGSTVTKAPTISATMLVFDPATIPVDRAGTARWFRMRSTVTGATLFGIDVDSLEMVSPHIAVGQLISITKLRANLV